MMNHTYYPSYASFMLRLAIIITSIVAIQFATAQLLSAYDQAYGQWNIKLSRNIFGEKWHLETVVDHHHRRGSTERKQRKQQDATAIVKKKGSALQLMFPINNNDTPTEDSSGEQANTTPNAETIVSLTHKPVRSINCMLNLQRNGKFTIHIDDPTHTTNYNNNNNYCNNYQPLHGEWFLTPNPYCITDRHYDEITLISVPRIRRVYLPTSTVVEKATVELRCKLWGRYSAGAVRRKIGWEHGRSRSRMSHGSVLAVKETFKDDGGGSLGDAITTKQPQRDIVGTFCGRAIDLDRNGRRRKKGLNIGPEEKVLDVIICDDDAFDEY